MLTQVDNQEQQRKSCLVINLFYKYLEDVIFVAE